MTLATKEAFRKLPFFIGGKAKTFIAYRYYQLLVFSKRAHINCRFGGRIFGCIGDNLAESLLY